jgi:hypothetical protein
MPFPMQTKKPKYNRQKRALFFSRPESNAKEASQRDQTWQTLGSCIECNGYQVSPCHTVLNQENPISRQQQQQQQAKLKISPIACIMPQLGRKGTGGQSETWLSFGSCVEPNQQC